MTIFIPTPLRTYVGGSDAVEVNAEDVRYLPQKEQSNVSADDTLSIIPSIAGGAS